MSAIDQAARVDVSEKPCRFCGEIFFKPKKISVTQWKERLYCSARCFAGIRKGVPMSDDARAKMSASHKGSKKPWCGRYKRTEKHLAVHRAHMEEYLRTPEVRKKQAISRLGYKHPPETIEKMKEVAKLHHNYQGGSATRKARKRFYQKMREHKKRANGGAFTINEWTTKKAFFGNTCPSCQRSDVALTIDHIIPIFFGGPNSIENVQPLCRSCNSTKHITPISYLPPWPTQHNGGGRE